ncbi:hypothetical protein [Fibrella forsythiae]|uniref:DUF2846 domain-containing protein n=1 Tax=Fibrella forsythiae TaxID=2817061 RepID=A0ABS3JD33_9BACT|nr:hypothetical protein [Fibrella forsythiae]MBO0947907.1 hypothetical protein [Fibrella forsythiae]
MKRNACILLFYLLATVSYGQPAPTRIYLVRNGSRFLNLMQFRTTLDPNKEIKVKNSGYTLIETDADSLGIIIDTTYPDSQGLIIQPKPVFVNVEKGKSYFFKLGPVPAFRGSSQIDVDEMTERAFWLYVGLNQLSDTPTRYLLTNANGLTKVR